jgi:hypothetical protein
MARSRRIIITGEQRTDIDAPSLALVIIRLARQWLHAQAHTPPEAPTPPDGAGKPGDEL